MSCNTDVVAEATTDPAKLESEHVHVVYDQIANHFSATRYKPWPVVDAFLKEMPAGSLGADIGCGNGKYLDINPDLFVLGSDRSLNLINICHDRGFEAMVCDNLSLPYRSNSFDFAISIAVIHHFATPQRRKTAIKELLRILRPGGRALIFVWALEQESKSKRQYTSQDVFVPWKMPRRIYAAKVDEQESQQQTRQDSDLIYQRYYHMFTKGELDELAEEVAAGSVVMSGYDCDNHYVIIQKPIP
ncbi:tRNA methyltransferase, has a role in tRNA modification [Batrachochytrium dendrobatidis]